jgi:hypothetical protein
MQSSTRAWAVASVSAVVVIASTREDPTVR